MRIKNHFHIKGVILSLALKQRLGATGNDLYYCMPNHRRRHYD